MERLREIRLRKGLSQIDLSDLSGVTQATISEAEIGRRAPRPSTLRKLARALGVEVADFYEEPHPKAPPPQSPRERVEELRRSGKIEIRIETDDPHAALTLEDLPDQHLKSLLREAEKLGPGNGMNFYVQVKLEQAEEPVFARVGIRPLVDLLPEPGL